MTFPDEATTDHSPSTDVQIDYRTMLDTIETMWWQMAPVQGSRLRDAIRSAPESEWNDRPRILLALAASHRSIGSTNRTAALPWFRAVEKALDADPELPLDVRAGYHILLGACLRTIGQFASAREHLDLARSSIETDASLEINARIGLSAAFSLQLGVLRVHLGNYDEALFALSLARGLADEHLSPAEHVECLSALAYVHYRLGDFARAENDADLAEQHAEGTGLLDSSFGALTHVTRYLLGVERGPETAETARLLQSMNAATAESDWEGHSLFAQAAGYMALGSHIEALDLVGALTRTVSGFDTVPAVVTDGEIIRADSFRMLGEIDHARRLSLALEPGQHHVACAARTLALTYFTVGDPQAAIDALDACFALGDLHSTRTIAHVHTIAAAAQHDLNNAVASDIAFDRALLASARKGTVWPFRALTSEVVEQLLERAAERHQPAIVVAFIERLHGSPQAETQPLTDPLSEREIVIVRHLATGATLSQIGTELFISVNTVKSHVRSIYRKLSATNRREAMNRALQLGLHHQDR